MTQTNDPPIFPGRFTFRLSWLFSIFAKSRVDAIKKHMKEEGENLKNIVEKDGNQFCERC